MAKKATATASNSLIPLLKNIGIMFLGVVTGQMAGSAIGKGSAIAGIAAGAGGFHLLKKNSDKEWIGYFLVSAGAAMIATPIVAVNPSQISGLEGLEGFAADAKEGVTLSLKQLGRKFFLDKTPLASKLGLNGIEEDYMHGLGALSEDEANRVISQLIAEQNQNVNGLGATEVYEIGDGISGFGEIEDPFSGLEGTSEEDDFEDDSVNGVFDEYETV